MTPKPTKNVTEIARELGRYSLDAFEFLHRGLDFTVQKIHGPPDEMLLKLVKWMDENDVDSDRLDIMLDQDELPRIVAVAIEHYGGPAGLRERMNRHVGGEDLCWGLRDYSLNQWGLMAPSVLRSWGLQSTMDFGRMVFALVENDLLQKQPDDSIRDFEDVYDFDKAFGDAYRIRLN
ncbi:MAG: Minf_1886 family protein [Phycisphaerae bacterium]